MSSPFDPYQTWLGVTPEQWPLDHYKLLGLQRFEPNPAAIDYAANQRLAYVAAQRQGPYAQYAERLLGELTYARNTLLDPSAKAGYDHSLQGAPPVHASPAGQSPAAQPEIAAPPVGHQGHGGQVNQTWGNEPQAPPLAPPAPGERGASSHSHAMAGGNAARPTRDFVSDDPPEDANPFYARPWFPVAVVLAVVLIAGAVWGAGRWWTRPAVAVVEPPVEAPIEEVVEPFIASETGPPLILQGSDGSLHFIATTAQIHGESPQLAGDAIVGWSATEDWLQWEFELNKAGIYRVEVTYAAPASAAGGMMRVMVGETQSKAIPVHDTGGTKNFVTEKVGYITLAKRGRQQLDLRATAIRDGSFLVLRSLDLSPVGNPTQRN